MSTPDVVVDTNVLISAQRSKRGASSRLVSLIGTGRFNIHVSVPLIFEYEEVLLRQRIEIDLTREDIDDVLDAMCSLATRHDIHFLWRPHLRDEKDHLVLEVAVAARCEYIVTYNKSDFRGVDKFGIEIVDAREFLEIIGELP
jgi:putative PIN family toxin of toxin-antitoxin system